MTIGTCDVPFERGGGLCKTCRAARPTAEGARFCSRLVAKSEVMQVLLARASTVAATDASIILRGESGSGKEVVARAIHANSTRRLKPFVAVNCAALPAELLESELFGHARGAFTGATAARQGLFEATDGGTLLLDEIAEMPLPLQAKLLRALQDGEIRRVGESRVFSVDVRVICATHQDLQLAMREKRFREDLYFRLKVFTLTVPPLRERKEDIERLAAMFLEREAHSGGFTDKACRAMAAYAWPGNVRELQNAVMHGAVLSGGKDVDLEHLPEELWHHRAAPPPELDTPLVSLANLERGHIQRVLSACGGRQTDAARVLGIGRTTLWRKLKEHHLAG